MILACIIANQIGERNNAILIIIIRDLITATTEQYQDNTDSLRITAEVLSALVNSQLWVASPSAIGSAAETVAEFYNQRIA